MDNIANLPPEILAWHDNAMSRPHGEDHLLTPRCIAAAVALMLQSPSARLWRAAVKVRVWTLKQPTTPGEADVRSCDIAELDAALNTSLDAPPEPADLPKRESDTIDADALAERVLDRTREWRGADDREGSYLGGIGHIAKTEFRRVLAEELVKERASAEAAKPEPAPAPEPDRRDAIKGGPLMCAYEAEIHAHLNDAGVGVGLTHLGSRVNMLIEERDAVLQELAGVRAELDKAGGLREGTLAERSAHLVEALERRGHGVDEDERCRRCGVKVINSARSERKEPKVRVPDGFTVERETTVRIVYRGTGIGEIGPSQRDGGRWEATTDEGDDADFETAQHAADWLVAESRRLRT